MRYWVYQDSRILGPFNREDLRSVEGLHEGSLVCPDGQSGTRELDWAPIENIQELSSVFGQTAETARVASVAVGNLDEFVSQSHASLEKIGAPENWMESIQNDPRLSDLWGAMPEDAGAEKNWRVEQNSGLESRFAELQEKLEAQERRQNEILDRLGEKEKQLAEKEKIIEQLRAGLQSPTAAVEIPAPAPALQSPAAPEILPFGDDMEIAEPVSRREPVESGDANSGEPLTEPPQAEMDGPLILEEPEIPDFAQPAASAGEAPVLEAAPTLESPPVAAASAGEAVDALGIPEATPLKSVSEMPQALDFAPPLPEEAAPGDAAQLEAPPLEAPPLEAPSLEAPSLEAPSLEAPPLGAPPLEAPSLEAPPLEAPQLEEGGDLPPMPNFGDAPAGDGMSLEPPPMDLSALGMATATPETIDLSAPAAEALAPELTPPPHGDDPFAAPKTMMMGGVSAPEFDQGPGLNLTPPPLTGSVEGGDDLVGGMPPGMEGPPGSTPMPIPLGEAESMMGTPPPTPMPSMGQPDLPQTVMQGLGVSGLPTPMPIQNPTPSPSAAGFQDMMGGQGAPTPLPSIPGAYAGGQGGPPTMDPSAGAPVSSEPAPSAAPKQSAADKLKGKVGKLGGKKFLIGLVIAVMVLAGLLFMFLRNPAEVAKMAEMGPEQKAAGSFDVDSTERGPGGAMAVEKSSPFDQAPQAPPQQVFPQAAPPEEAAPSPSPQEAAPPPKPPPAAPPRRAYMQDQRIEAIEFVKGYRIDGGKEVVAQKLQYYFLGGDNFPEWQAGALEKNKWIVEYHVFKGRGGGSGKKPTVTYRFEVDLAAKNVKGLNGRARTLLGSTTRGRRSPSRGRSIAARQAPLPSEEQLDGAEPGTNSGFNNPGE